MMYVFVSSVVTRKVKPGAIGTAVPGYEIQVITEDGKVAKPGELGRLYARGPTGTLYWRPLEEGGNLLEKQKSVIREGWVLVGDFCTMDEEGYLSFVSRQEDLIKSSGYRIGPEEIEDALLKHPAVADAGVIGIPDPVRGQNVKASVILKPGHDAERRAEAASSSTAAATTSRSTSCRAIVEFVDRAPAHAAGEAPAAGPAGQGAGSARSKTKRRRLAAGTGAATY